MFVSDQTHNVTIENLRFSNSPMYHIKLQDVDQVVIRGIDIKVDIGVQQALHILVRERITSSLKGLSV